MVAFETSSQPSGRPLALMEAAAHFMVLPETIARLQYEKIFPAFDAGQQEWWRSTLEVIVAALLRDGVLPGRRLPYTYVVPRKLSDETYRYHPRWRHGQESKDLDGPRESALAARQWLEFERDYARRHPLLEVNRTVQPPVAFQQPSNIASLNQRLTEAHPSPALAPEMPKSVTQSAIDSGQQRQVRHRTASPSLAPSIVGVQEAVSDRAADKTPATRPKTAEEFLTEQEIATRYRGLVSAGTLRNWRHQKIGPPYLSIARKILYPRTTLLQWEAQQLFPKLKYTPKS
jgi:hypothetical protein